MTPIAQKIARALASEYCLAHRSGGRDVDEAELVAFIEQLLSVRPSGLLCIGGVKDGEFARTASHGFSGCSSARKRLSVDSDFSDQAFEISHYSVVPLRFDDHGRSIDRHIAVVEGMTPLYAFDKLVAGYRP